MEEARELQPTARRCTSPCSDPRMSRVFARFKKRILENIVRAGMGRDEARRRMRESGGFEEPRCAIAAREFGGTCLAYKLSLPFLRAKCYEYRLGHFESGSAAILEANNILSLAASEMFRVKLQQEGASFGIERPNDLYPGSGFPFYAQRMGAFLDKGNYDIGVGVLAGAISHAVMAKALGLDVLYVRAKRRGARIEFEPMCDLERIRGKRTLIIEDDMSTGRTMKNVVSELRRFGPAEIDIGLFSNTNPSVGESFMGCRIAYNHYKVARGEKGAGYDEETEYAAIARLLHDLRQ